MRRRWVFYTPPGGGEPVRKEIEKCRLAKSDIAKVQTIMDRVAELRARPGDVKDLREGTLEVRVSVARRQLRLLYAEVDGGLVLLALHFFQKQRQVEDRHIDIAVDRLREWRSRKMLGAVSPAGDMLGPRKGGRRRGKRAFAPFGPETERC